MRTDMELKLRGGSDGETLLGGTKIERFKWKDNISGNRADILLDETVRGWKEKYRWGRRGRFARGRFERRQKLVFPPLPSGRMLLRRGMEKGVLSRSLRAAIESSCRG